MEQETVLGLAAVLWPLLAAFVWWSLRLPSRHRTRSLRVLCLGAFAGIATVLLFASPLLLHRASDTDLWLLLTSRKMWIRYAVAAPLGALIAHLLTTASDTSSDNSA